MKKSRPAVGAANRVRQVRLQMSLSKFIKRLRKSQYFRDLGYKIVVNAVWVYIFFACLWTICYLVGEILQKMGVG